MKPHVMFTHWVNNRDYTAIFNFIAAIFVFGVMIGFMFCYWIMGGVFF